MATTAETHHIPNFPPPPSFLDYPHRRLPQPITLPPLTIPLANARHETPYGQPPPPPPQALPSIHSAPPRAQPPLPRAHPGPAAPLDKLLSPHPYTPPRSDPTYSPPYESRRSPPRSAVERLPPRRFTEVLEEPRALRPEPHFVSPIEQQHRHSFGTLPSPTYTNTPNYPPPTQPYRTSVSSQHSIPQSPYAPAPPYAEPANAAPRPFPSAVPQAPPQEPPAAEKSHLQYKLIVRQQPIAARACGFGERDRRVIDPPPIIQLQVTDPQTGEVDLDELRYSLNVVHCTLWNADGSNEETALIQPDRRTTRRLMGQLVASPSVAKDEHDKEGCFFCFPDLSCRTHGKYRLRFVLMRIDPVNLHVGGFSPILTDVMTEVFQVYTAKDFPGMRPSSALTRALKLQGCNIQVKKGNEKALVRKRASPSDEDDEDADGDKDGNRNRRRRKD